MDLSSCEAVLEGMMKKAGSVVSGRKIAERLAVGSHGSFVFDAQSAVALPDKSWIEKYVVGYVLNNQSELSMMCVVCAYSVAPSNVQMNSSRYCTVLIAFAGCAFVDAVEYEVERLPSGISVTKATTGTVCVSLLIS